MAPPKISEADIRALGFNVVKHGGQDNSPDLDPRLDEIVDHNGARVVDGYAIGGFLETFRERFQVLQELIDKRDPFTLRFAWSYQQNISDQLWFRNTVDIDWSNRGHPIVRRTERLCAQDSKYLCGAREKNFDEHGRVTTDIMYRAVPQLGEGAVSPRAHEHHYVYPSSRKDAKASFEIVRRGHVEDAVFVASATLMYTFVSDDGFTRGMTQGVGPYHKNGGPSPITGVSRGNYYEPLNLSEAKLWDLSFFIENPKGGGLGGLIAYNNPAHRSLAQQAAPLMEIGAQMMTAVLRNDTAAIDAGFCKATGDACQK